MNGYDIFETGDLDSWAGREDGILPEARMPGRLFVDRELDLEFFGATVNSRAPGEGAHFWHRHTTLEELYLFLTGVGVMGLDDDVVAVGPGTAVRVAPPVWRTWRAAHDSPEPLRWICVRGAGAPLATSGDVPERDFDRPQPRA
ncbi:cupin domain-containing protein [Demequina sp. NBRC 110052]|uniref:cupin domain-containing protein n=1 Tax=Demequina sp. NBRC 110052 TaxID=1570341 RepID=UPI000A0791D8|nr:cupin domain-containing protein [Demequina sp. NBRC 110052]